MNNTIFKIQRKLFPNTITSSRLKKYLLNRGIEVGNNTIFYEAGTIVVDDTRPCLLSIGDYCKITSGVVILTHDYSRSVLRRKYGTVIGEGRKTIIGNNVFIGMNSIVLMGSQIGDNVIIGAGSVIAGKIPNDVVVAGNPARIVRTLEEHYRIRNEQSVNEAFAYVSYFNDKYHRLPTIKEMNPFYQIFMPRDIQLLKENEIEMALGGDQKESVISGFMNSTPLINGYEEFINRWREQYEKDDNRC